MTLYPPDFTGQWQRYFARPVALPTSEPICLREGQHCYCVEVEPLGERTKPHEKCCMCGHLRLILALSAAGKLK